MTFTNDTKPSTTFANDSSTSEFLWDDADNSWDSSVVQWGGFYDYDFGVEPTTSFTNDNKP